MRTFPAAPASFRQVVDDRGQKLRALSFEDLRQLVKPIAESPIECLVVDGRSVTIGTIVEQRDNGTLRVVVQGFMNARYLPFVKQVALDGFYKHPDEAVSAMPRDEFYEFD